MSRRSQVGNIQLGDVLGKGAFGTVVKGLDISSGKTVAVKKIKTQGMQKEALAEVEKEWSLLAQLDHPNILKCYEAVHTPGALYLVLEYAESGSLQQLLKRFGHLEEPLIARYLRSTLLALAYLHSHNVIHRDIKAANILMTKTGDVKVADFGIATTLSEASSSTTPGSPFWLAPEVIEMEPITSASDLWSLGCTIIELLTGNPPYFELNSIQAMYAIVQDKHPPMPKIPISAELTNFLEQCFQANPNDRPSATTLLTHRFMAMYLSESVPDYYRDAAPAVAAGKAAPPSPGS